MYHLVVINMHHVDITVFHRSEPWFLSAAVGPVPPTSNAGQGTQFKLSRSCYKAYDPCSMKPPPPQQCQLLAQFTAYSIASPTTVKGASACTVQLRCMPLRHLVRAAFRARKAVAADRAYHVNA